MKRRSFLLGLLSLPFVRFSRTPLPLAESVLPAEVFAFGRPAYRVPFAPITSMKLGRVFVGEPGSEWDDYALKQFPTVHGCRKSGEGVEYLVSSELIREIGPLDHIPLVGRY